MTLLYSGITSMVVHDCGTVLYSNAQASSNNLPSFLQTSITSQVNRELPTLKTSRTSWAVGRLHPPSHGG